MKCSNCGNEIDEKTVFCNHCGTKVEKKVEVKPEQNVHKEVDTKPAQEVQNKQQPNVASQQQEGFQNGQNASKTPNTQKKKKSKAGVIIAVIILILVVLVALVGGIILLAVGIFNKNDNKANNVANTNNNTTTNVSNVVNNTKEDDEEKVDENQITNLNFSNMYSNSEFSEGIYVVYNSTYGYIAIDENGKYLFTLTGAKYENYKKYVYQAGYVQVDTTNLNNKVTKIIDKTGNVVMSTEDEQYDEISYKGAGFAAVKKTEETYNSVSVKYGLVNVKTKEYLLGPSEDLQDIFNATANDSGIYKMSYNSEGTVVYNAKTKQQITLKHYNSDGKFYDNYMFVQDSDGTIIVDTNGTEKLIEGKSMIGETASEGLVYCEENCFCDYSGEIKIDLSNEYHNMQNKPTFSNGYALLLFRNDAGTDYFTIIDSTGKRMIEPQKYGTVNDKITKMENNNLLNGYVMVQTNSKKVIMDYSGKIILEPETGETFEKFDGKYVYVTKKESSYTTKQYFKDLSGNKIIATKE